MHIEENIPLAPFTTFRLGGPARFFARARTTEELCECLAFAKEKDLKVLLLGGGSNMLVGDDGFDGLVIKIELAGIEVRPQEGGALLVAAAGEGWDALVERSVAEGLWGLENLSGIPGTVGAAPVQNIGAYGVELANSLAWVEAYDTQAHALATMGASDCRFGYRTSIFKQRPGRWVITKAAFSLRHDGAPNLAYNDLQAVFVGVPAPALVQIREAVLAIRAQKFPDMAQEGTAGSFFLNPVVSQDVAQRLQARFPELPQFQAPSGVKVSLAWLLDRGLGLKGAREGGARLFERQPLVVVVSRDASSRDVRALADIVKSRAQTELGIALEEEVRIV